MKYTTTAIFLYIAILLPAIAFGSLNDESTRGEIGTDFVIVASCCITSIGNSYLNLQNVFDEHFHVSYTLFPYRCSENYCWPEHWRSHLFPVCWFPTSHPSDHCAIGYLYKRWFSFRIFSKIWNLNCLYNRYIYSNVWLYNLSLFSLYFIMKNPVFSLSSIHFFLLVCEPLSVSFLFCIHLWRSQEGRWIDW